MHIRVAGLIHILLLCTWSLEPPSQVGGLRIPSARSRFTKTRSRGEGCDTAMSVTGVARTDWTPHTYVLATKKLHGITPNRQDHKLVSNHKRSFKRAVRRAQIEGYAWFRGKLFDAKALGTRIEPKRESTSPSLVSSSHQPRIDLRNRLHFFSWNCSGLSRAKLDEILLWARPQPIQLLALQETRWQESKEWSDDTWHFVAVGGLPRQSTGVLLAIRKTWCCLDQISWRSLWDGRLLHLRIHFDRPLDVLNFYQKTYQNKPPDLAHRLDVFRALDNCLSSLPTRNNLILLGDFNTSLPMHTPNVGSTQFRGRAGVLSEGPAQTDQARLLEILVQHGLCALNTMTQALPATFYGPKGLGSRIDFACTRLKQLDHEAKQCAPIPSCPLLGTSTQGHHPLIGSLSLTWKPWSSAALSSISYAHRTRGRLARSQGTKEWTDFQTRTSAHLTRTQWPENGQFRSFHQDLNDIFVHSFSTTADRLCHLGQVTCLATRKWALYRLIRTPRCLSLGSVFEYWKWITQHRCLHREQKTASTQARQNRIDQFLSEARAAADRQDLSKLHQLVRKVSPKEKTARIQIRSATGQILSPIEEFTHIKCFVQATWHDAPLPLLPALGAPGVPFSAEDLERAFARLASLKANAPGTCASLSILSCPALCAKKLFPLLMQWWNQPTPFVPVEWKNGHLFLLPKPGKPPNDAKNLRPLALQDVFGKVVLGLVSEKARHSVLPLISSTPQLAYLPFRGTADAIARATQHCLLVAQLARHAQRPVEKQATGMVRHSLVGGALLSLDLSKAFDSVSRSHLFQGMAALGVRPDCLHLLYEWHRGTHYDISHKGFSASVPVYRGVRQGCKAAPFLWCCLTTLILNKLAECTSWNWVTRNITIYADDFLVHQTLFSLDDLNEFTTNCGILLDILKDFHLQINIQKCFSMVTLQGIAQRKAQARHLKRTSQGWHLCFPRTGMGPALVALHTVVPYLGIKLSYKTMQSSSLQHRLQCGLRAFRRLRTWFCSKKGLTSRQKESLWSSVVRTTTLYNLHVVGCSAAGLRQLISQLTLQQRMFMHDHSHETHRTHADFHAIHQITPPAVFLRRVCVRTLEGREARLHTLDSTDILHQIQFHEPANLLLQLDQWISSQAYSPPLTLRFQCRTCLGDFPSAATLARHEQTAHGRSHARLVPFRLQRDALAGLPQCRHCDKTFGSWTNLRTHIEFLNCPMFDGTQVLDMEMEQIQRRIVPLVQDPSLHELTQSQDLCNYMLTHCCLCGKHQSRFSDMIHHLQLAHGNIALTSQLLYRTWSSNRRSPCDVCQVQYSTSHQCKILLQAAVIHQWHRFSTEVPRPHAQPGQADRPPEDHVCLHCADLFPTRAALEQHLRNDHPRFCCSRDTIHGTTVCRHCGSHFGELWELRRHIERGSCDQLDPLGDQELGTVLRSDDYFMPLIQAGKWGEAVRESAMRHQLTMMCSFCGQAYSRTADLVRHLQCHHGGFYREADLMSNLVDEAKMTCICKPCRIPQPRSHRCPAYRQLAMLQYLLDPRHRKLILPWTISPDTLHKLIQLHAALHAQVPALAPWLQCPGENSWEFLLRDSQILSTTCALCSRNFETSIQLFEHLLQQHRSQSGHNGFLLHVLYRFLLAQRPALCDPLPCPWCHTTLKDYALEDDSVWALLTHKCAPLLNLGCALTWLRPDHQDGRGDGSSRRRQAESGGPGILKYARITGRAGAGPSSGEAPKARSGPSVPATEETSEAILSSQQLDLIHEKRREWSGHEIMQVDGATSDQARGLPQLGLYAGLVCAVLPTGELRSLATPASHSKAMARPSCRPSHDPPALLLDSGCDQRVDQQVPETQTPAFRRLHQASGDQEPDHPGRLQLPASHMAPPAQAPGHQSDGSHLLVQHGDTLGHPSASILGTDQLCPLFRDGLPAGSERGRSLEIADIHAQRFPLEPLTPVDGISPVASDRCTPEATWTPEVQAGTRHSDGPATSRGEEMKRKWMEDLCNLACTNDSNWCYANAGLISLLWTLVHSASFNEYTYGHIWTVTQGLLRSTRVDETIALHRHPALTDLFQGTPSGEQRDIAEFVSEVLAWCRTTQISQAWERRFENSEGCHCYEAGSDFQPVALVHLYELDAEKLTCLIS